MTQTPQTSFRHPRHTAPAGGAGDAVDTAAANHLEPAVHPALIAIVRLLARQATGEWLQANSRNTENKEQIDAENNSQINIDVFATDCCRAAGRFGKDGPTEHRPRGASPSSRRRALTFRTLIKRVLADASLPLLKCDDVAPRIRSLLKAVRLPLIP